MAQGDNSLHEADQELMRRRLDGSLVIPKCRIAIDTWVIPLMIKIVNDDGQPFSTRMDAANWLTKVADVIPKAASAVANTTSAFQLNIVLPSPAGTKDAPVNITPVKAGPLLTLTLPEPSNPSTINTLKPYDPEPTPTEEIIDHLPPKPHGFEMPRFHLTNDLVGPTLPRNLT